jgi:hypothetical protein
MGSDNGRVGRRKKIEITMPRFVTVAFLAFVLSPASSYAGAALLLEEPYGRFGSVNPTGHAAVYLTRICAESPTYLRRCRSGEVGAVISRYHRVAGLDWIAVPLIPYLYAVERADHVPDAAHSRTVADLRDEYRRMKLVDIVPDRADGKPPKGQWIQLMGAVYDRRVIVFSVATTDAQDDALIEALNAAPNNSRFNLFFRNCADFARDVLNFYYPKALRTSFISDLGFTTPKHIAKSLVHYGKRHPEVQLSTFAIEQIPGSRPDSHGTRGVLESLIKTKKYVVPLTGLQPWVPAGLAAGYLVTGRFDVDRYGMRTYGPTDLEEMALVAATAASK